MAKTKTELKKMTKVQLEDYGRTVGIELDRRLKKDTLIEQLVEYETPPKVIKSVKTKPSNVKKVDVSMASIEAFINTLPAYTGKNAGAISSLIMKHLAIFAGNKIAFGPKGKKEYQITVKNKTFKL